MAAYEIRRLHRKIAQLDRRVGLVDIAGKVKPGSQDMEKRTVILVLGQTSDGKDILSPPIRWQGTGAGAFKMHATPADNEQMTLHSPSGTIGNGSMAHWGTYDQDNPPPSTDKDTSMLELDGKARVTWTKDKHLQLDWDGQGKVRLTKDGDVFVAPGDGKIVKVGVDPDKTSGAQFLPVLLADMSPAKNLHAVKG